MNNVIPINSHFNGSLRFTEADKKYLSAMASAFNSVGLPHELAYGLTDEGQEWCLVRKLIRKREQSEWNNHSVIVGEIIVTSGGYRHAGNWGPCTAHSLKELFADLMPSAYENVRQGVQ